ncbi:MAG: hypothetical protein FWD90_02820 [Defluviitaleaceae bacterium]|nr:hypothetical protein [Defluviitaleaceae bacterium]
MVVNIINRGGPIVWEGVYYFTLSDYPNISNWELKNIILFCEYEKRNGRTTEIICEDNSILQIVNNALTNPSSFLATPKPNLIFVSACKDCKKGGCLTDYLCHTTEIQFVESIFKCGKLLSAVKARNQSGTELSKESRNAAKDTPDYFDYVMFTWGNCFAGDSLVMERMLGGADPTKYFGKGFKPGVRFYFRYEDIVNHKDYEQDGHHPAKVKNELSLVDYLHCCIIPNTHKAIFDKIVPPNLADRVFYIEQDCKDIWEWSDKVYEFISTR